MNELKFKQTVATIYYRQDNWHNIINDLIQPELSKAVLEKHIIKWTITLGDDPGEHLVIKFGQQNGNFEAQFDDVTNKYLGYNPSKIKPVNYPLNSFYQNFPVNSIWFDNLKPLFDPESLMNLFEIAISNAIINSIAKEKIDIESRVSLALYLYLSLIKIDGGDSSKKESIFKYLIFEFEAESHDLWSVPSDKKNSDIYLRLLQLNSDIILEIVDDVWSESNEEVLWLNTWLSDIEILAGNSNYSDIMPQIIKLIFTQLGLKNDVISLINNLLRESLVKDSNTQI